MGGVISQLKANEDFRLKTFIPNLVLLLISFAAAGLYYYIEKDKCGIDFWKSLYFINTAHTTIGYGNITPCTAWGKVLAIVYIIISVPIQLIALDSLGKFFAAIANAFWLETFCCCCCFASVCRKKQKAAVKPTEEETGDRRVELINQMMDKTAAEEQEKNKGGGGGRFRRSKGNIALPIWIGFMLLVFWILGSGVFFMQTESGWTYWDGLYFTCISITTMGFGDNALTRYESYMVISQFAVILIGLALFSLCVNLIQDAVDRLKENIRQNIVGQYQAALEQEQNMEEHESTEVYIDEMIKKEGPWQRHLVDKKARKILVKQYELMASMKNATTQTPLVFFAEKSSLVKETLVVNKENINRPFLVLEARSELENLRMRDTLMRRRWIDSAKWKQMKVVKGFHFQGGKKE